MVFFLCLSRAWLRLRLVGLVSLLSPPCSTDIRYHPVIIMEREREMAMRKKGQHDASGRCRPRRECGCGTAENFEERINFWDRECGMPTELKRRLHRLRVWAMRRATTTAKGGGATGRVARRRRRSSWPPCDAIKTFTRAFAIYPPPLATFSATTIIRNSHEVSRAWPGFR